MGNLRFRNLAVHRRTHRIVGAMLLLALTLAVPLAPADAVIARAFAPRISINANGAIDIFGNSQVTCPAAAANCVNARAGTSNQNNNSYTMEAVDADGDGSTVNSSMSTVTFPADATVRFAGLYWGSCNNDVATRANAKLRTPGGTYSAVTASQVDAANGTYQSFLDVTSTVAAAGPGDYWLADMTVCAISGGHSGWSLVVVWEHSSQPMRNLTVFDGYGQVTTGSTADRVLNVPVSGFLTPPSGAVNLEVGLVSYEGDSNTTGDGLFLDTSPDGNTTLTAADGVALRNPLPDGTLPATSCTPIAQSTCNAFNSTNSDQGTVSIAGNPGYANLLGFDIDEITANGILPNSSTSMELTLTTAGDFYYPGVVTTAVDLYAPAFPTITKTVVDLNGGVTAPGDVLEYTLVISNIGDDGANQSVVTDPIPAGTTFVPGSLSYVAGLTTGTKTDAVADDEADYVVGTDSVRFRIGTGADGTTGGVMGIGATQTVRFQVSIDGDAGGTTVENQYRFDYVAQTIGLPFAYNSNTVATPVAAVADIWIEKNASASPILAGDLVTYTLTGHNDGPSLATNVVATDVLPAGVTFVSASAGCSGTTTVACALGDIAVGDAVDASITVRADAGLADGALLVNGATIAADTADLDPLDNTTEIASTVDTLADLRIAKSASPDPLPAGGNATYTLTVTNDGPSTAIDAVAVDALPAELTYVSHTTSHGSCLVTAGYVDCDLGDLAPNDVATIEVEVEVDSAVVNPIVNTATTGSSTFDPDSSDDSAEDTTSVVAVADVRVTKAAVTDPIVPGEAAQWAVTVINDGPADAQNVTVSDAAPSGVSFTNAAITLGVCTTTVGTVDCAIPTIPSGSSVTVTIDGDVASNVAHGSSLANTASIGSDTPDLTSENNEATSTTPVVGDATLQLVKEASPDPLIAGVPLTYTLTVENLGPSDAAGVTIVDTLPTGVTFTSAPGCSHAAGVVTCNVGTVAAGADAVVAIVAATDPGLAGPVENTAVADSPVSDPVPASVTSSVEANADLEITKAAAGPVVAGEDATWRLDVLNNGPSNAAGIEITDTLPAGMTPTSAIASGGGSCTMLGQDVSCTYASLAPGQTRTVTIVAATAPDLAAGSISNTAVVSAASPVDLEPSDNTHTALMTVSQQSAVSLTKSGPANVVAGDTGTWTIEVVNAGPSTAADVVITDLLPAGVSVVSTSLGLACSGEPLVTCAIGDLAPGASGTVEVVGLVASNTSEAAVLTNTAQVSTSTPDDPADDSDSFDSTVQTVADLLLVKSAPASVNAGLDADWTIELTNDGPSDAIGVQLTDVLPAGAVPTGTDTAHPGATCLITGQAVSCDLGIVPAGATVTVVVSSDIASNAALGSTLTNQAEVTSTTSDPDTGDNLADATVTVTTEADLSITKAAVASPVSAGDEALWTISVLNHGPSSATNVVVNDSLPPGVTLVDLVPTVGSCTVTTCDLGDLAPGALATIAVRVLVDPVVAEGTNLLNGAAVSSDTPDPDEGVPVTGDNESTASIAVVSQADLIVDKNHDTGTAIAGLGTSWTITVENQGPSAARSVQLQDVVPAGIANAAMTNGGTPCDPAACDLGDLAPGQIITLILTGDVSPSLAAGAVVQNSATVTTSTTDPDPGSNVDSDDMIVSTLADLSVDKEVIGSVVAGEAAQWQIEVTNNGPSAATDVTIADAAPSFVTFTGVTGSPDCAIVANALDCAVASLAPGASVTVTIDATVDSNASGSIVNTASASSVTTDPDPLDDSSTTTSPVSAEANLIVTKDLTGSLVAGGPVQWTITVTNDGPSVARSVAVSDTVPSTVTGVTATSSVGTCTVADPVTCALGDLASGASETVVIAGSLDPTVAPAALVVNSATVSSSTTDGDPSDNVAVATDPATTSADVRLDKVLVAGPIVAGEPVSWTLTIVNDGPSNAAAVQVSDVLPAVIDPDTVTVSVDAGTCAAAGLTVSCELGVLGPAATVTATITGTLVPGATGSLDNTASVASTTADPDNADNSSSVSGTIATEADLSLTKSASPATLTAGLPVTYTIEVENLGPSTALAVEVADALPSGLTLIGATSNVGTCVGAVCTVGDLPPGSGAVITVIADVDPMVADGATLTNEAAVASSTPDPDSGNDLASSSNLVERQADLVITKVPITTGWAAGEDATYEVTVTNLGPSASGELTVVDPFPGSPFTGTSAAAGCAGTWPADIVCTADDLGPTDSVTFTITAQTDGAATATTDNVATVSQVGASDPDSSNDEAAASLPYASRSDLSVTKVADSAEVVAGTTMTYTVTVANAGPSTARAVQLDENLPAGFSIVALGSCGAVTICALGDLAPGASVEVTVQAAVAPGAPIGARINEIVVSSTTADPTSSNNTGYASVDVTRDADLSVVKTAGAAPVTAGTLATWTVTVTNDGPSTASDTTITDLLPAGVEFDAAESDSRCSVAAGLVTCNLGTLASGSAVSVIIGGDVDPAAPAAALINAATGSSTTPDSDPDDNTGTVSLDVDRAADVSLTKSPVGAFNAGMSATWQVVVTNAGPSTATALAVADNLPAGFVVTGVSPSAGTCTVSGGQIDCTIGELVVGGSVSVLVEGTIDPDVVGQLTNTATVTAAEADPDPTGNESVSVVDIYVAADLSIAKVIDGGPAQAGAPATWIITVVNNGPAAAADVTVTDANPTGFIADGATSPCVVDRDGVVCALGALAPGASVSLVVTGMVDDAHQGPVTNVASVASSTDDPLPDDNEVSADGDVDQVADLRLDKRGSNGVVENGDELTWTMTVENLGPSVARDVELVDDAQLGFTAASVDTADFGAGTCALDAQGLRCSIDELAVGDEVVVRLTGTATRSGEITNVASVSSSSDDPTVATSTAAQTIEPIAALEVTKVATNTAVEVGGLSTWVVTVVNRGPDTATDVVVVEEPGAGLAITGVEPTVGTYDAATNRWLIPSLALGATAELTVTTRVSTAGALPNAVSVTGANLEVGGVFQARASIVAQRPSAGGGGILAFTGANAGSLLTIGLALVGGGAAFLLISRRSDHAS